MEPKSGKTSTGVQFPNSLLVAFEKGYNAISGVVAQPIDKWSEFKRVLRQLESDEVKSRFDTIVIDTVDIAHDLAEKHICQKNSVAKIGDMEWGSGYRELEKEFDEALRSIPAMGYGLVMISHSGEQVFKDDKGEDFTKIVPTLGKSARKVVSRMADIYGYIRIVNTEEGNKTLMYMRGTPYFEAGSRFPYTPSFIELSYDNLNNAIADAIDKQEEEGAVVVSESETNLYDVKKTDYKEVEGESREIIKKIMDYVSNIEDTEEREKMTLKTNSAITEIVEEHLGEGQRLTQATEEQVEMIVLIVEDLKELQENMGIE